MTPVEYCYQKAAIPGSALYFSTRHLDPLIRDAIVTICAFYKEIEEATLNFGEPTVILKKLNWWRKQITKIRENKADHPIAVMMQTLVPSFDINPIHLTSIIDGLEQNLCRPRYETFEDVVVHIMRTAGTREFLIATLLQQHEVISQEIIYQFALVLELVNYVQNFRKYSGYGLFLFSNEELEQFKILENNFQLNKTSIGMKQLFHFQSEKIEKAHQTAYAALSPLQKNEMSHIIVRSDIALTVLKKIQSKKYNVLEEIIDISPLRCWWVAWRSAAKC